MRTKGHTYVWTFDDSHWYSGVLYFLYYTSIYHLFRTKDAILLSKDSSDIIIFFFTIYCRTMTLQSLIPKIVSHTCLNRYFLLRAGHSVIDRLCIWLSNIAFSGYHQIHLFMIIKAYYFHILEANLKLDGDPGALNIGSFIHYQARKLQLVVYL